MPASSCPRSARRVPATVCPGQLARSGTIGPSAWQPDNSGGLRFGLPRPRRDGHVRPTHQGYYDLQGIQRRRLYRWQPPGLRMSPRKKETAGKVTAPMKLSRENEKTRQTPPVIPALCGYPACPYRWSSRPGRRADVTVRPSGFIGKSGALASGGSVEKAGVAPVGSRTRLLLQSRFHLHG